MTGAVVAGILGFFLKKDVDDEFEGTEYIDPELIGSPTGARATAGIRDRPAAVD